jgi:uncharacterized protein (TIGR03118 family)
MQRRAFALISMLGLVLVLSSSVALAQYQLTNLVSNQFGQAKHDDPLSVNAWGLVRAGGSPWWVSDAGSGWSTLYNGAGVKQGLIVEVPPAPAGAVGSPTGVVYNESQEFQVQSWASIFVFDTLDGTISGWAPQSDFHNSIIAVDNSASGTSYTGLAITSKPSGNVLFAADNAHNKVDMYDGQFRSLGSFTDTTVPAGFSVFGIRDIDGVVLVSFASSSGAAGGFVDLFSESGKFVKRVAQGAPLNQPWGFAVAPSNFGPLSNTLLISNNTNTGTINGFNAATGQFVGVMKDTTGAVIHIDQLWAIDFGGGTPANGATNKLFFTAGPHNNLAGTFGSIVFK